ncbi:MAG TPA: hypothetical protein VFS62_04635, partial [Chloroflexota bacterium]|nr:hypothetical protein [Chloroflexota bacterium]
MIDLEKRVPGISRRRVLRFAVAGVGLAAVAPILAACGGTAAPATSSASPSSAAPPAGSAAPIVSPAASGKPASSVAASAAPSPGGSAPSSAGGKPGASPLPTYIPQANGPKPDFPAPGPLYEDGFTYYPKNPPKVISGQVGSGSKVQVYTNAGAPIPPAPVDKNPAWQEVNKQLNADLQFTIISQADYTVKFATLMAGNDLPDMASVSTINPPPSLTQFLQQSAADLTPFLAGDAAKNYPNLAAIPTNTWRNSGAARGGKLFMLPIQRYPTGRTLWTNKDTWNTEIGPTYTPKNSDDFKRVLQVLNKPSAGRYGMGGYKGQAYYFPFFAAMFGAPNGWSLVGGKLTKDLETPQYKEAAGYVRDLVASQLFHPDALTIPDPNTARGDFLAGKISLIVELFGVGWQDAWTRGLKQNPVFIPAPVLPFA